MGDGSLARFKVELNKRQTNVATDGPVSSIGTPRHSRVNRGADSLRRSPRTVETPFQIQPPQFSATESGTQSQETVLIRNNLGKKT